jgi:serine/threonine protein kinase
VTKHITPLTDTYEINTSKPLGKGTFGVVVVGKHRETSRLFAIKIVSKDNGNLARIEREVKLMSDIDHANIVRLFGIYDSQKEVR